MDFAGAWVVSPPQLLTAEPPGDLLWVNEGGHASTAGSL